MLPSASATTSLPHAIGHPDKAQAKAESTSCNKILVIGAIALTILAIGASLLIAGSFTDHSWLKLVGAGSIFLDVALCTISIMRCKCSSEDFIDDPYWMASEEKKPILREMQRQVEWAPIMVRAKALQSSALHVSAEDKRFLHAFSMEIGRNCYSADEANKILDRIERALGP